MSQIQIQIGRLKDDLRILVVQQALPQIIALSQEKIKERIAKRYAEEFYNTRLFSELNSAALGESPISILGLRTGDIEELAGQLPDIIEQSTEIVQLVSRSGSTFKKLGEGNAIAFVIRTPSLPKNLIGKGFGRYTSENGYDVPWLTWLLQGSGDLDHGVLLLKKPSKASRTGYAIMLEVERNVLPFNIDDYNRFTDAFEQGDNERSFLAEMAQSETFRQDANAIIYDELLRTINSVNITI